MADFGLTRLPSSAAEGTVVFARYTPGMSATIPVGTTVLTAEGSQSFAVLAQATNPAWNGTNGYTLAASLSSISVPLTATVAGAAGNVLAGQIGLIASPIAGVDTVSNPTPLTGGCDPESDAAFRTRFQLYINSRSLATTGAVAFAITSVQQGLRYAVIENQNTVGEPQPGNFCVIADDGTGSPSSVLLAQVQAAVDAVRPIGATYSVAGPGIILVTVTATLETSNPLTHAAVAAAAQASILSWISGLPIGGTLAISKIDALVHATDPGVLSVMATSINGAVSDITAAPNGILLPQSVTVS
jgi:phage-related baseplate assembly protein